MKRIILAALFGVLVGGQVMAAEWNINNRKDAVDLSITGNITHGERQRLVFRKGNCDRVIHTFSAYSTEPANFEKLVGRNFLIELNGEITGANLEGAYKAMLGHLLYFNLGGYGKEELMGHLKKNKKLTIKFIDGKGYKASDYFDMPYNEWSTTGITEAFKNAFRACSQ